MRSIAHHDHGQKPERMKFLRIIFGCPDGARKWRILYFAMLLHSKKLQGHSAGLLKQLFWKTLKTTVFKGRRDFGHAVSFWLYQREPPAMPGGEKSFSEKPRNIKNPSIEQKWFADHISTAARDSNWQYWAVSIRIEDTFPL